MTEEPILSPKAAEDSRMSLAVITQPSDANVNGMLHGGVILRLADECGGIVAASDTRAVAGSCTAGDRLVRVPQSHLSRRTDRGRAASVTYVGRSSIECHIQVFAEPLKRAERRKVGDGFGLYVALDPDGRPRPVPPLSTGNDEDAIARQAARLAKRNVPPRHREEEDNRR